MPRRARVFAEGLFYHVYNHVTREERPFARDREAERFVSLLREIGRRDGWTIVAWCVMPNHFHLLVRVGATPLGRSMHDLQHRCAVGVNRRTGSTGPLWRSRYQAKVVGDESYLARVLAYVHLNPVAAGLVRDPARYRWSGHVELLGRRHEPVADVGAALALLEPDPSAAVKSYTALLRGVRDESWLSSVPGRLPWWSRGTRTSAQVAGSPMRGHRQVQRAPDLQGFAAQPLLAAACAESGTTVALVASRLRTEEALQARHAIALVLVERWAVRISDLAAALGRTGNGTSHLIGDAQRRRSADPLFAARIDDLDRRLLARFAHSPQ